ncbi:MAG TPA: sigma 54-interacting transcriptional regulator [Pyrinomonadaceae bacterium]|nr:sigma 54-interacting transcriptional regulator [Pyrinomonadaceae bacterium]
MKQTPSTVRVYSTCFMGHVGPTSVNPGAYSPSEDDISRERTEALRWRSVFDNSAIGVAVADLNGRVLATNSTYQKMLGYSESEFEGLSFLEITHEDYREANWALVTELLEGKRDQFQFEKQYWRKDRSLVWVRNNVSLVRDPESTPRFMLALSEEITERKEAEEALQQSEERARLILNSAGEGIFGCDSHGTCLFANTAAAQLLGYDDPEQLLEENMHLLEHHTRKDGTPFPIEECPIYLGFLENCGVHIDDDIFWRKDGTSFDVEYWSHPLIRDGKTVGAVVTFLDITERKRAEEALRKSEQRNHTLLEINNTIITNLTRDALFSSAYEAIRGVIPFDRAAFLIFQPESNTLKLLSMDSPTESDWFRVGKEYDLAETRISAWVLENQEVVTRGDLKQEQQSPGERRLIAEGIQSYCVVPLVAMGKSIGTFAVWSETPDRYTESDAELLRDVANQMALAIANMKSYEEIAALKARLEKENVYLQEEIRTEHNFEEIVGDSPALLALLRRVDQVAPTDSSVLIYGETGTGKELIARAIHDRSNRKNRPLVKVNCSAISAGLVESELFGHAKGAFTGAFERRIGRFELADGGTIFLDEVGELPLDTQVKLLRVLQEREFEPVGSNRSVRVDVRIICATNRKLEESIRAGTFRSDLYYRLNVFPLEVPPLRDRRSDIEQLAKFFISRYARNLGKRITGISELATEKLLSYSWPGNVRELQNVIERALIVATGPILNLENGLTSISPTPVPHELPPAMDDVLPDNDQCAPKTLQDVEREHILAVLQQTHGVIEGASGAAKTLGLHPNTLRHRMEKLGIKRPAHRIS